MSRAPFQFKQFTLQQSSQAFPIGTDGILLGAWFDGSNSTYCVDLGTGTGLIGIMAAQRFPNVKVDLVEKIRSTAKLAHQNASASPWNDRIDVHHTSVQHFQPAAPIDHIISNPPFFQDGIKPSNSILQIARHTDELSFKDIIDFAVTNLAEGGQLSIILPFEEALQFHQLALEQDLHLVRHCGVRTTADKPPKRSLCTFAKQEQKPSMEELTIQERDGSYSKEFKELTEAFYLDL